jgi:hypothetical protein
MGEHRIPRQVVQHAHREHDLSGGGGDVEGFGVVGLSLAQAQLVEGERQGHQVPAAQRGRRVLGEVLDTEAGVVRGGREIALELGDDRQVEVGAGQHDAVPGRRRPRQHLAGQQRACGGIPMPGQRIDLHQPRAHREVGATEDRRIPDHPVRDPHGRGPPVQLHRLAQGQHAGRRHRDVERRRPLHPGVVHTPPSTPAAPGLSRSTRAAPPPGGSGARRPVVTTAAIHRTGARRPDVREPRGRFSAPSPCSESTAIRSSA